MLRQSVAVVIRLHDTQPATSHKNRISNTKMVTTKITPRRVEIFVSRLIDDVVNEVAAQLSPQDDS